MVDLTKLDIGKLQGRMPPGVDVVLEPGNILAIWESGIQGSSLFRFRDGEWQSYYALGCFRGVELIESAIKAARIVDEFTKEHGS